VRISLPYHDRTLMINLPGRNDVEVVGDRFPTPLSDVTNALHGAVHRSVNSLPLRDLLPVKGRICILISDLTRGGGLKEILDQLLAYLGTLGVGTDRVDILLAMGMHRGHTKKELESHLGRQIVSRWNIFEHDATNDGSLIHVGTTPAGTPCMFNRRIVDSGLVIMLGSITFHYFAGYGGARKLILPGAAGEQSIIANHRLSLKEDPGNGLSDGCRPGNLEGNPVHEDMLAGARLLPPAAYAINYISDDRGRIVFVNAGELDISHREACRFLWERFHIPLKRLYRAVVFSAGGFPRDINLLQSHKALRHASYALDEGGIMLAAAACSEGIGSSSYRDSFRNGREMVPDMVREDYMLNSQTAMSTYELTGRFTVHLASMLEETEVSLFGFSLWRGEQTEELLEAIPTGDILVIRNMPQFLPWRKNTPPPSLSA